MVLKFGPQEVLDSTPRVGGRCPFRNRILDPWIG